MGKPSALCKIAILVAALGLASVAAEVQALDKKPHPTGPDAQGNHLYIVDLQSSAVEAVNAADEPPARDLMDPQNVNDFRGWHKPKVRKLVKALERQYDLTARTMTSHAMPSFSAYIPEAVVAQLRRDPRVERVIPTTEAADFSQVPPWSNQTVNGEIIPYGKIAIGTNDGWVGGGNVIYMIDAGMPPQNNDLVNIVPTPVNPGVILSTAHASHVAGILSAAMNNAEVRGVNPGATIYNVNRGSSDDQVRQALDWVLGHAESIGAFAIANISSNSTRWADGDASQIANFMRRLSNRALVVQSAGNQHDNACTYAYGPAKGDDGLLVVSGVDENGTQPVPFDNSMSGWGNEPGANWGPCVEMWAPSQRVWSTWDTSPTAIMELSGTSMAAPHVTALAARFGSRSTTPVQRENEVRSRLRGTGFADDHGGTIVVPSYTQPISYVVAAKLYLANIYADASYPGYPPSAAADGNYLSTSWNSGHGAPAWIELDLGTVRNIHTIRLSPSQSPSGPVTHYIYAGNSPSPGTFLTSISATGRDLEPLTAPLFDYPARYVRIYTASSPSWVAWREIEIYGY